MKFAGIVISVVMFAMCACLAQSRPNPSEFDVDGVRLGMSVDQAEAALRAYGIPYTARVQFPSRLGKGPFVGAVVGLTGKEFSADGHGDMRGDHIAVLFAETDGKAYSIDRTMDYGALTPTQTDVLMKRVKEKYGDPTPVPPGGMATPVPPATNQFWEYDPAGKAIAGPWNAMVSNWTSRSALWSDCALQEKPASNDTLFKHFFNDIESNHGTGLFAPIPYHVPDIAGSATTWNQGEFDLYTPMLGGLRTGFGSDCGVSLKISYQWGMGKGGGNVPWGLTKTFEVSLFDNQLASKNMVNLINYANGVRKQEYEEKRKKSEEQKPF
jgi:hypothetical protein